MKTLNDKLMMQDILAHLRDLMQQYGMTIQHSNCPNVRANATRACGRTAENQFMLFKLMNDLGYYPIKNVTDEELKQCIQMHECKTKTVPVK
jgi:spore coat protein CotF